MDGVNGWAGWRWYVSLIFRTTSEDTLPTLSEPIHSTHLTSTNYGRLYVIEGLLTIAWAFCCIFLVPKSYETAYFLNADEKAIMRLRAERAEA